MKGITVIIPVYNAVRWLSFCLSSIVVQEGMEENELILIDDCSTDDSAKIISDYAEKYRFIVPVYHKENQGCATARNNGLAMARGKYVLMCDNDDRLAIPKEFAKRIKNKEVDYYRKEEYPIDRLYLKKMESIARKFDADIVYGEKVAISYAPEKMLIGDHQILFEKSELLDNKLDAQLLGWQRDSANAALYRKDFLDKHNLRFETELKRDSDIVFTRRAIACAERIARGSDAVYLYHICQGSLCDLSRKISTQNEINELNLEVEKRELITLWYALTENWQKEILQIFSEKIFPEWDTRCTKKEKIIKSDYVGYWDQYKYCENTSCEKCDVLQNEENLKFLKEKLNAASSC
jgi:glycosyltransferase involved in cell wall biosynthesis